ncbi:MAG: histidine kinase [Phenylobacterium zucineum]|nr:MAG: histidine kinase [Phenylobacterium zucineum]
MAAQLGPPAAAIRAHEEMFSYWNSLKGAAPAPSRGKIDPGHMKRLLPTVSLMDVLRGDGLDYRVRLAGTGLYGVYAREITGLTLAEIYNSAAAEYWRHELSKVVHEGKPGVGVHSLSWRGASHLSIVWLRLPLMNEAGEVNMILGYDAVVGMGSLTTGIRPAAGTAVAA